MAFTRAGGVLSISALQRSTCKHIFSNFFIRMSSHTSKPPQEETGSSRQYALGAAVFGGLLSCGIGFAYKAYADQNSGFSNQINENDSCEESTSGVKLSGQGNFGPTFKFLGSENQVSCAANDECPPKCEESSCIHSLDKEEEMIAKANAELEAALKDVKPKAMDATESALKAYCEAAELVKVFMDKAYCAAEQDTMASPQFEEVWCEVYEAAKKRCEKVKEAMAKGECAWELLCRLRELVDNGKACKYTQCNPLLITAEEALLCAERELLNAKARVDCIQSESRLVEQYRNLVEDFRRDLKAEVDSMLTENPECKATFTENECTMILTHAYKKILRIQKELSQVQPVELLGKVTVFYRLEARGYYCSNRFQGGPVFRQRLQIERLYSLQDEYLIEQASSDEDDAEIRVVYRHLKNAVFPTCIVRKPRIRWPAKVEPVGSHGLVVANAQLSSEGTTRIDPALESAKEEGVCIEGVEGNKDEQATVNQPNPSHPTTEAICSTNIGDVDMIDAFENRDTGKATDPSSPLDSAEKEVPFVMDVAEEDENKGIIASGVDQTTSAPGSEVVEPENSVDENSGASEPNATEEEEAERVQRPTPIVCIRLCCWCQGY